MYTVSRSLALWASSATVIYTAVTKLTLVLSLSSLPVLWGTRVWRDYAQWEVLVGLKQAPHFRGLFFAAESIQRAQWKIGGTPSPAFQYRCYEKLNSDNCKNDILIVRAFPTTPFCATLVAYGHSWTLKWHLHASSNSKATFTRLAMVKLVLAMPSVRLDGLTS